MLNAQESRIKNHLILYNGVKGDAMTKQNNIQANSKTKTIVALLFLIIYSGIIFAQSFENINLPESPEGGSMILDIVYADNKIFAYSHDGISIFSSTNYSFEGKIPFETIPPPPPEPQLTWNYGKFNPVYFNSKMHIPDANLMVYNNETYDRKLLFALTPNMRLLVLDTENITNYWFVSLTIPDADNNILENIIKTRNGNSRLLYDNNNNRLYFIASGKNQSPTFNCTGEFHKMQHIFAIYSINYGMNNALPPVFTPIYSEYNSGETSIYGSQINNCTYNKTNDLFYVIRLGSMMPSKEIIQIYNIVNNSVGSPVKTIELINNGAGQSWHKMGKILNIYDPGNNLHEIVVFPYRYQSGGVPNPQFYIIDGDNYNSTLEIVACPSSRILDAVYLSSSQDILMSYSPTTNINPQHIAISDGSGGSFTIPATTFNQDNSPIVSDIDLNSSFKLTKINNSSVLVARKDGVAKIDYNSPNYTYTDLLINESNFYGSTAVSGNKYFINNRCKNGIKVIDGNNDPTIKCGFPVYHITGNHDGTSMAYFNRLDSYNLGFYYRYINEGGDEVVDNINSDLESNNDITHVIGDIVFNPYQDHFLVSVNSHNSASVMVLDEYFHYMYTIDLTTEVSNTSHIKTMFVAKNGKIYIAADMNYKSGKYPSYFIYNAENYDYINSEQVTTFNYSEGFVGYSSHYAFNPYNDKVYASLSIQESRLDPYNNESSSIFDVTSDHKPIGKIVTISDEIEDEITFTDNFPNKIICPYDGTNTSSQYYGKIFIIGEKFSILDYVGTDPLQIHDYSFIDVIYCKHQDLLFAVKDNRDIDCLEWRKAEIWKIYYDNGSINFDLTHTFDGQITSMTYNEFDQKVYLHLKTDAAKLAENQSQIIKFNPEDISSGIFTTIDQGFASYYSDFDHTSDPSKFFLNNRTTPYINPYTNHIYLPNGGHSCISKIEFTPVDQLVLEPGINWISFPRLVVQNTNPVPQVDDVLMGNIAPTNYLANSSTLKNLPPNSYQENTSVYTGSSWTDIPGGIQSKRGYKIDLDYSINQESTIDLHGTILSPYSTLSLYEAKENWVGYFIPEEQDIFDAIADYEESIYEIKSQDFYCYRGDPMDGGSQPQPVNPYSWFCDQVVHNIAYGEMVVLKPYTNISNFRWNYSGNPPPPIIEETLDYFEYTETDDYIPFIITLDTTENPLELGAFVNDSCIGACTLEPEDSLAIIRGYIDDNSGDSVVFEEYFGTKSTQKNRISEYYVFNESYNIHEKRAIKTNENKLRYFISMKNKETISDETNELSFKLFPNPTGNEVNIVYTLDIESKVAIVVCDYFGRYISTLFENKQTSGGQVFTWNLQANGEKIIQGIYIIRLTINNRTINKKLVVQ